MPRCQGCSRILGCPTPSSRNNSSIITERSRVLGGLGPGRAEGAAAAAEAKAFVGGFRWEMGSGRSGSSAVSTAAANSIAGYKINTHSLPPLLLVALSFFAFNLSLYRQRKRVLNKVSFCWYLSQKLT